MVLLAVLAVGTGASAWRWRWFAPAVDPMAEARRAYREGEWTEAAERARQRLRIAKDDVEAMRIYARASLRRNRDEVGTAIYKDRLGPDRMEPEDYLLVGQSLARLGRDETALQVWEKGAAQGPDHAELLENLARRALAIGQPERAVAPARRLTHQPGWEDRGWLLLGEAQYQLDDPLAAAEALDRGMQSDAVGPGAPDNLARERRLLARSWLQLGRPAEARPQLERVLADGDTDREAQWLLSRAWLQQGRIEDATLAMGRAGRYRDENPLMPEPAPYLGSDQCTSCHPEQGRTYPATRHARTFHRGPALAALPMPNGPLTDPDDPGVTLTFRRDGGRVRVETRTRDQVFHAVVAYAFGTPDRYLTMIGRGDAGDFRALRLSHYRDASGSGWGRTSGDVGAADPHETIRGRAIDVRDGVVRCLACHVTRPRAFRDPPPSVEGPEAADPAIGCERCHGPGGNHLAAVAAGLRDRAIAVARAGSAPAAKVDAQCVECHITDIPDAIKAEPENPRYVRSPGLTFTFSRCATAVAGKDRALTCLTCHDPHRDDDRPASFYESRCLSCHASTRAGIPPPAERMRSCPVNPATGCLDCHMPRVPVTDLHTTLTDHYIRVHRQSGSGAQTGIVK
ncbi:MAG: tetratricopeptide repeat protein [Isosphaeraceae bacterium]